ncbi:hypothetical protein NDA01_03575 [Trichocoleus desertorum AS-A10]|uniref:hypothetical protein n=1 Tax=Trichocoleus desertorum TaxID=1481672 RepID=UPI003298D42F
MSRYAKKRMAHVLPFIGSTHRYGFKTNVEDKIGTEAGHKVISTAVPNGMVIGANAPKPARGTKTRITSGKIETFSTFVDATKLNSLPAGWSVSRPKVRRGRQTPKTVIAYVTIRGVNYAWNLPKSTQSKIRTFLAALGIKIATTNDKDLVFGASYPKPPKAGIILPSGQGGIDTISTFVDPSVMDRLPDGWKPLKDDGNDI